MIINTLTLNPALDRTMYFDAPFESGRLNRATQSVLTLGGKGINVSRMASLLGIETIAYGFSGGRNGEVMQKLLDGEGIKYHFICTAAETRMNIKMIDSDGRDTEANERGGPVSADELSALTARIREAAERQSRLSTDCPRYFALGGSIPDGVDKSVYKRLTEMIKSFGISVVLDCDGEALKQGLSATPSLIKPNMAELSGLVGTKLSTVNEAIAASVSVCEKTGVSVLCTMSENGALFTSRDGVWKVNSPSVTLRGFTGAGDTFLTSFLSRYKKYGAADALLFASSAAAAKVELPGTTLPEKEQMTKFVSSLRAEKIK